jgi:hypothetical protein
MGVFTLFYAGLSETYQRYGFQRRRLWRARMLAEHSFTRSRVTVRRRAVLVVPECERPHPKLNGDVPSNSLALIKQSAGVRFKAGKWRH